MNKIQSLKIDPLEVDGSNYLKWSYVLKAELHAKQVASAVDFTNTPEGKTMAGQAPTEVKWAALAIILGNLSSLLQDEFMDVEDPNKVWDAVRTRYLEHVKTKEPAARAEFLALAFSAEKTVVDYNAKLNRIVTTPRQCGKKISEEELIEKTLSTMQPDAYERSERLRESVKTYAQLFIELTRHEQRREVQLHNFQKNPTANSAKSGNSAETHHTDTKGRIEKRKNRGRRGGRGRGGRGRGDGKSQSDKATAEPTSAPDPTKKNGGNNCGKCGGENHAAADCRAGKRKIEMYQEIARLRKALTAAGRDAETNYADATGPYDPYDNVDYGYIESHMLWQDDPTEMESRE